MSYSQYDPNPDIGPPEYEEVQKGFEGYTDGEFNIAMAIVLGIGIGIIGSILAIGYFVGKGWII